MLYFEVEQTLKNFDISLKKESMSATVTANVVIDDIKVIKTNATR